MRQRRASRHVSESRPDRPRAAGMEGPGHFSMGVLLLFFSSALPPFHFPFSFLQCLCLAGVLQPIIAACGPTQCLAVSGLTGSQPSVSLGLATASLSFMQPQALKVPDHLQQAQQAHMCTYPMEGQYYGDPDSVDCRQPAGANAPSLSLSIFTAVPPCAVPAASPPLLPACLIARQCCFSLFCFPSPCSHPSSAWPALTPRPQRLGSDGQGPPRREGREGFN